MKAAPTYNSTYMKLAFQWLNETFCFVSSLLLADSFRLLIGRCPHQPNLRCLVSVGKDTDR